MFSIIVQSLRVREKAAVWNLLMFGIFFFFSLWILTTGPNNPWYLQCIVNYSGIASWVINIQIQYSLKRYKWKPNYFIFFFPQIAITINFKSKALKIVSVILESIFRCKISILFFVRADQPKCQPGNNRNHISKISIHINMDREAKSQAPVTERSWANELYI